MTLDLVSCNHNHLDTVLHTVTNRTCKSELADLHSLVSKFCVSYNTCACMHTWGNMNGLQDHNVVSIHADQNFNYVLNVYNIYMYYNHNYIMTIQQL